MIINTFYFVRHERGILKSTLSFFRLVRGQIDFSLVQAHEFVETRKRDERDFYRTEGG